ncbi:hypothetical protein EDD29_8606 [Actinocorallia herbida]|uniref:Uncharacterized protein n=1 Tax=Actinocorallia herbida TaxID=58109 RepID=A0A3N1DBG9_9ACTN|nr:hypothetical protein [Actinocorallia herbida]ROO90865.1 hypothetical protein EDD29_8606 [Actinocorallia herbida]
MLTEATAALAAMGGTAVVQAATQDGWTVVRARVGRGLARRGTSAQVAASAQETDETAETAVADPGADAARPAARNDFPVAAINANAQDESRQINIAHLEGNPTFQL